MLKFVLSPNAARSITEIDDYTAEKFGTEQAIRYTQNLLDRFEFLCEYPDTGRTRDELKNGYFSYFEGSHTQFITASIVIT